MLIPEPITKSRGMDLTDWPLSSSMFTLRAMMAPRQSVNSGWVRGMALKENEVCVWEGVAGEGQCGL